jgi:hypothetical protein
MLTFNNLNLTGRLTANAAPARDGSIYFNGVSDYLTIPNVTEFDMGTLSFTVEGWIYLTAYPASITNGGLFGTVNGSTSGYYLNPGQDINTLRVTSNASGAWQDDITVTAGNGVPLNTWTHLAMVRNGDSLVLYKNGVNVASRAGVVTWNYSSPNNSGYVGYSNDGSIVRYVNGYITNVRVVKGTAVYTSAFTPSTIPLPVTQSANVYGVPSAAVLVANTALLLSAYNEPFYTNEYSANNRVISVLGAPGRSGFSPFYTKGSLYFDGASYLTIVPNNANLNLGTGDFTIESWVYPTTIGADMFIISSSGSGGLFFGWTTTGYGWGRTAVAWDYQYAGTKTPNVWQHIALTRSGTAMKFFINGIQAGATQTLSTAYNLTTGSTTIGSQGAQYYWNGYITNLRVVKGTAAYTANFIPSINILPSTQSADVYGTPSAAIPSGNTVLLMNTSAVNTNAINMNASGLALLDSSPQNNSIANTAGYVKSSTFSPF